MPGKVDYMTSSVGRAKLFCGLADSVVDDLAVTKSNLRRESFGPAVALLYRHATKSNLGSHDEAIEECLRRGCRDIDLHDICIGRAAQRLGEDWVHDRRSFAEVSRASAWLYGLCKFLGERWSDRSLPNDSFRRLVLATVPGESHLIGPAVLAQKLRRAGNEVSICCNESSSSLIKKLNTEDYDGLLISVATEDGLENVRQAVTRIQQELIVRRPIVLGGAALALCDEQTTNIGVDLVTNDEQMALQVFDAHRVSPCLGAAE